MTGEILSDRYVLRERLATGRFLSTYLAEDTALGTVVSVDVLEADALPAGLSSERLEEILDAAASVRGERVAIFYGWGRVKGSGQYFMVGERVEGANLLDILEDCGELPSRQVVEVARAAVEALAEAYGRGLFYIGLNPGQVVVSEEGDIKILRVGYGWILEESEPLLSQRVSPYRAPETDGGLEGKRASDVYALAVMIRGMLSRDSIAPRLRDLLETAADPLPRNRPSSPRLVLEELEASLSETSPARDVVGQGVVSGAGGLSFLKETASSLPLSPGGGKRRGNILRNLFLIVAGGLALWLGFAAVAGMLSGEDDREETISAEEEEEVTLPDLQGLALEEAQGLLRPLGLECEYRHAPSRLWSAGRVAAQEPPQGSVLRRGDKVILVVSAGREGVDAGSSDADGSGDERPSPGETTPSVTPLSEQDSPAMEEEPAGGATPEVAPKQHPDSEPEVVERAPSAPRAVATLSATSGAAPLYVSMDASSSHDPDGDIVRYVWLCGDGTVLEGITVTHVFDPLVIPARFQVVLRVFDSTGLSASATAVLEVY